MCQTSEENKGKPSANTSAVDEAFQVREYHAFPETPSHGIESLNRDTCYCAPAIVALL